MVGVQYGDATLRSAKQSFFHPWTNPTIIDCKPINQIAVDAESETEIACSLQENAYYQVHQSEHMDLKVFFGKGGGVSNC